MKYIKREGKLLPILSQILDSKTVTVVKNFDIDSVITDSQDSKYALVNDGENRLVICDSFIDLPDYISDMNYCLLMAHSKKDHRITDSTLVQVVEEGKKQCTDNDIYGIESIGNIPSTVPIDCEFLLNPINSELDVVQNLITLQKVYRCSIYRMLIYQDPYKALRVASNYNDFSKVVKFSIDSGAELYLVLTGWVNTLSSCERVQDSLTTNNHLKHLLSEFNKVKDSHLVNPVLGSSKSIKKIYHQILDAKDDLQIIEDNEYSMIESATGASVATQFHEDDPDAIKEYLDSNPDMKIVTTKDGIVYISEKDVDNESTEVIEDSINPTSLEGYTKDKVSTNKYDVLFNGEAKYVLEKKNTNWTCSCPGYKHRGNCKHLGLLEDILPKRYPMSEMSKLDDIVKDVFKDYDKWEIVGSYRRGATTFKDIDVIVESTTEEFVKILDILKKDENYKKTVDGNDIIRGYYFGLPFDVSRVVPGEWGSYLLYRTGSANFNKKMRRYAKERGMSLNEHGLFDTKSGKLIANQTEEGIFEALNLPYVNPSERN